MVVSLAAFGYFQLPTIHQPPQVTNMMSGARQEASSEDFWMDLMRQIDITDQQV